MLIPLCLLMLIPLSADANTPVSADANTPVSADAKTPVSASAAAPVSASAAVLVSTDANTAEPADVSTGVCCYCPWRWTPVSGSHGLVLTWWVCFLTKLACFFLSHLCLAFYRNLSPVLFTHQLLLTCAVFWLGLSFYVYTGLSPIFLFFFFFFFFLQWPLLFFLCGPLETQHVDRVSRPLEDGILVIEVTVGLQPLSANTSLWPGLHLHGRSGRPSLTSQLVAPLLWGCFTRVSRGGGGGVLAPVYIVYYVHSPRVTSPDIP